jgi:hypothetical protein
MRQGKTSEHRVSLQGAVGHQARPAIHGPPSQIVGLVPTRARRHDHARVDCVHRRPDSSTERTCPARKRGSDRSVTATRPLPRRTSCIGTDGGSSTTRPSSADASSSTPGSNPRASRMRLGRTIRPARSIATRMA